MQGLFSKVLDIKKKDFSDDWLSNNRLIGTIGGLVIIFY